MNSNKKYITLYPIVEYTYDVNPAVDNKCLGKRGFKSNIDF